MSLLQRQAGLPPRPQAAREAHDPGEALAAQRARRLGGASAVVAADDHGLFLALGSNFRADGLDARKGHVLRAEDVAGAELAGIAHVDDERVFAVDELR